MSQSPCLTENHCPSRKYLDGSAASCSSPACIILPTAFIFIGPTTLNTSTSLTDYQAAFWPLLSWSLHSLKDYLVQYLNGKGAQQQYSKQFAIPPKILIRIHVCRGCLGQLSMFTNTPEIRHGFQILSHELVFYPHLCYQLIASVWSLFPGYSSK